MGGIFGHFDADLLELCLLLIARERDVTPLVGDNALL
jgi:hypothetical protein